MARIVDYVKKYEEYKKEFERRKKIAVQTNKWPNQASKKLKKGEKREWIRMKTYRQFVEEYERESAKLPPGKRRGVVQKIINQQIDFISSTDKPIKLTRAMYKTYVEMYKKKAKYLASKGKEMKSPVMSYAEWKETYLAYRNDLVKQVDLGIRGQVGSVNHEMVNMQAYETTFKQAIRVKQAFEKKDREYSLFEIRVNYEGLDWDLIKDEYNRYKDEEKATPKEAAHYIAQYFFGSP